MDITDAAFYADSSSLQSVHVHRIMSQCLRWERGDSVLDVGCGTGRTTQHIAHQGVKSVVGIDKSPDFISYTKENAEDTNVSFSVADIQRFSELEPSWLQSFDKAVSFYVLHLIRDKRIALENIRACLKPGGQLLMIVPTDDNVLMVTTHVVSSQMGQVLSCECPLMRHWYSSEEATISAMLPFLGLRYIPAEEQADFLSDWWASAKSMTDASGCSALVDQAGKELAILHTDDYTTEFVLPLQAAASASGVPCHTEIVSSSDSITEKTVELLLNTNNKMVLLVISPQALHHQHWSNLTYEFPVRNEKLLLPILLYPQGSRDRMVRVLQQRSPVLFSLKRKEIEMGGSVVSQKKLGELIQKVVIGEEEENRLYQISKAVGEVWTRLGQELGLEPSVLDDVKGDDNVQTTLQMLKAWRIKTPHGPLHYLPQLAEALQNIGTVDQAKAVQETYKDYRNGLTLTELSPDMNEDKSWSLHLPDEGKYVCKQTGLGVVTPYPLGVTSYRSENWSDYSWPEEGEDLMPVGPLLSIQCVDVEGPVDLLLPHVMHLANETEITTEDLRVVHVVGDSPELLPVTELTSSHAVTRFKKGSKFGVVGKKDKVSSVSTDGLLTAFRSIEDSDLSILNVYIVSNVRSVQETIEQDENKWGSTHCHTEPCQLQQGGRYCLEGKVTNGEDICVSTSPQFLIFENTLDTNKFYKKFRVEVSANIWSSTTSRLLLELLKTNNDERKPILQLTLGRYKRSCTAEETDSGVSTPTEPLESVRRRLQDTLSTSDFDACVPVHVEEYFDEVISKVSYKWDELARKLGFDRGDIKAIETTVSLRDPDQRCREILERWSNKHASEATLQDLQQALTKIGERRTAEDLEGAAASHSRSIHLVVAFFVEIVI
uniref:Death domain-containing protein n=1 Tax=Branchiostoma floridae TaxID=7739 RepID=C3Y6Z7_BRAFL|eukprot:XP_002608097.1 hypothetical protein BRAFLDRAFT_91425 [Branchiostoma floridae]